MDAKRIVITGASSGIGLAIFKEIAGLFPDAYFLLQGCHHTESLSGALKDSGVKGMVVGVDFTDELALTRFMGQLGACSLLVAAAAKTVNEALPHLDLGSLNAMIRVNISAYSRIVQQVLPAMVAQRKGCIVSLSSVAASRGNRGQAVYAGSKGYVEAFTRAVAAEYGAKGIRANCVAPGPIESGHIINLMGYAADAVLTSVASRRLGCPEDVAHMTAFLCSDRADFINGRVMAVDGGFMSGV